MDAAGDLYIADTQNNAVREISASGVIATIAGTGIAGLSGDGGQAAAAQLNKPQGVAVDTAGNLYIADTLNIECARFPPAASSPLSPEPALRAPPEMAAQPAMHN
jgi:DNA-binding beta-propeller fold protein YncE